MHSHGRALCTSKCKLWAREHWHDSAVESVQAVTPGFPLSHFRVEPQGLAGWSDWAMHIGTSRSENLLMIARIVNAKVPAYSHADTDNWEGSL